eukprot:4815044-Amphidinium_carterae.1
MHRDKVQKLKTECPNAEGRHPSARAEPMTHSRTIRFTGDARTYYVTFAPKGMHAEFRRGFDKSI